MGHDVSRWLHTIRHDGAIAQHMITFPIIERVAMDTISKSSGGIACKIAGI